MKEARFTLEARRWYAAEFIGDEFLSTEGGMTACSPIRVDEVVPAGARQFALGFYHAAYPEGVRDKRCRLQTIERGAGFMLARSVEHEPMRLMLLHPLSAKWLAERCHVRDLPRGADLQRWCATHC